jgi:hypothetical protein
MANSLEGLLQDLLLERSCLAEGALILFPQMEWDYPISYHESNSAKWVDKQGFSGDATCAFREEKRRNVLVLIAELLRPLETPDVVEIGDNIGIKITWKFKVHETTYHEDGFFITTLFGDLEGTLFVVSDESDGGVA